MGALLVVSQEDNPDRVAQSAHGIRELMEKLPEYLKPPIVFRKETMKDKIRPMKSAWEAVSVLVDKAEERPLGSEKLLRRFVEEARMFFDWLKSSAPDRATERQAMMQRLDPGGSSLLRERVIEWTEFNNFFQKVAHHRSSEPLEDFLAKLGQFETFLLSVLAPPPTFDRTDDIDDLLEETGG